MHLIRLGTYTFMKRSNLHELYGLDFMLDEDLYLWFIEANPNPLLTGVVPELIIPMLFDLFDIEFALYKSRMKRIVDVVHRMQQEKHERGRFNLKKYKEEFELANKNQFDDEFPIRSDNTFTLVLNEGLLPSADAYLGKLPQECITDF